MVAFAYRMGTGFPGDVNRTHPASILPCLVDASAAPTAFGQAVVIDTTTQGVRPVVSGDSAIDEIFGVTVRPYPFQQQSATNYGAASFGGGTPPQPGAIDILRAGYIMVNVVGTPNKGGRVYIWYAASSGSHVQGGFEAANTGGSTLELNENYFFNGPPGSDGVCELGITI